MELFQKLTEPILLPIWVIFLLFGILLYRDSQKFAKSVLKVKDLIDQGESEDSAIIISGYMFWALPWYNRIFRKCPSFPSKGGHDQLDEKESLVINIFRCLSNKRQARLIRDIHKMVIAQTIKNDESSIRNNEGPKSG